MTEQEVKELREQMTLVRIDLGKLDTKLDGLRELTAKVAEVDKQVVLVGDSSKAAHKRLDRVDKIIFWAATTVIGGVILAAVAMLIKTKGS